MTLDEAIKHCKEKAKELRARTHKDNFIGERQALSKSELDECLECAKEHEQLAEWLTELKAYKACPLLQDECYFCNADKCHNGGQK